MGGGLLATNVEDIDSMKAKGRVFKRGGEDNEEDVEVRWAEEGEDEVDCVVDGLYNKAHEHDANPDYQRQSRYEKKERRREGEKEEV
jgi:hypothetical protein